MDPENTRAVSRGFVPMASNPMLEKGGVTRRELNKGAFSDEARDALANAVANKKETCIMDGHIMKIRYMDTHVFANCTTQMTPCGMFFYDTLKRRPWNDKADEPTEG